MAADPDDSIHARRPPDPRSPDLIPVRVRVLRDGAVVANSRGHAGIGRTEERAILDLIRKLLLDAG